jgi:hypothetical protein
MASGLSGRSGLSPRSAEVRSKAPSRLLRLQASTRSQPSVLAGLEDAPTPRRSRESSLVHGELHRSTGAPQAAPGPVDAQSQVLLEKLQRAWDKVDSRKKIVLACALG